LDNSSCEDRELGGCFYVHEHLPRDLGRYMAGWSGVLEPKRGLPRVKGDAQLNKQTNSPDIDSIMISNALN
jgi:hypothetical protein